MWRYSRVDDLYLEDFTPVTDIDAVPDAVPGGLQSLVDEAAGYAALVVVRNGRVVHRMLREDLASKGVRVEVAGEPDGARLGRVLTGGSAGRSGATPGAGSGAGTTDGDTPEPAAARGAPIQHTSVGSAGQDEPDAFVPLNDAFAAAPLVVEVPSGVDVDGPVVLAHWSEGDGTATFPRVVVDAGANSDVKVVEVQASSDDRSLVVPMTEILLERDARVGYVTLQQLALRTWQIGRQVSSLGANATLRSSSVGFGGDYARLRTDCRLEGRGASGHLDAVYFGEGDQMLDFRTFQDHIAPDSTSNLLFKGAVGGRSKSVYTGLIRVGREGGGTSAFQTNRNIKLSDHAWAESVPNLVIETNDVRCSHASAVGPIDDEQRFYLESRGVPTDIAERLIVSGFFGEVLAHLPVPALVGSLQRTIADKFERREG